MAEQAENAGLDHDHILTLLKVLEGCAQRPNLRAIHDATMKELKEIADETARANQPSGGGQ